MQVCRCTAAVYRRTDVQAYRCTGVQVYRCAGAVYRRSGVQVYRCTGVQAPATGLGSSVEVTL